jgi:hypothetical protein
MTSEEPDPLTEVPRTVTGFNQEESHRDGERTTTSIANHWRSHPGEMGGSKGLSLHVGWKRDCCLLDVSWSWETKNRDSNSKLIKPFLSITQSPNFQTTFSTSGVHHLQNHQKPSSPPLEVTKSTTLTTSWTTLKNIIELEMKY